MGQAPRALGVGAVDHGRAHAAPRVDVEASHDIEWQAIELSTNICVTAVWTDEIRCRIDEVEAGTAELHNLGTVRAGLEAASRA